MILLFICGFYAVQAQGNIQSLVDSLANQYLAKYPYSNLAIGISIQGKELHLNYVGRLSGTILKADSNSIYEIGRITETFTSILFADLSIHGVIGMDDPLQKYLPVNVPAPVYREVICKPSDKIREPDIYQSKQDAFLKIRYTSFTCIPDPSSTPQPVLLCYLATHTSGLPEFPGNLKHKKNTSNPISDYSKDQLYEFLIKYTPEHPVGFEYKHSDLGIALLGHAMSLRTKTTFDSLLIHRLLAPMGLQDTRIHLSTTQQKRLLKGHTLKGRPAAYRTFDVFAPAGALHSSLKDMLHFLSFNIRLRKDSLVDLLDFTHNPRLRMEPVNVNYPGEEIALGWRISPLSKGTSVVWQSDVGGGFASYIGFVETSHTGIVVLSNTAASVTELGKSILLKIQP